MTHSNGHLNLKFDKLIPVDEFIDKVLYKPNAGYYTKKNPFGGKGDFITDQDSMVKQKPQNPLIMEFNFKQNKN